jgi:hypothetical protein
MWWGTIIGLGLGAWLSYSFILPVGILGLKLAELTIGDVLRVFGGLAATILAAGIGYLIDVGVGNAD